MKTRILFLVVALVATALGAEDSFVPDLGVAKRLSEAAADADYAILNLGDLKSPKALKVTDKAWLKEASKILGDAIYQPSAHSFSVSPALISFIKNGQATVGISLQPPGTRLRVESGSSGDDYEVGKKVCDALIALANEKRG